MTDVLDPWTTELADRYRIERTAEGGPRVLGEGGMATVYAAVDLKHQRKVAIKVLRPNVAAVVGAERFLQEIRVTANLQHPHILGLLDSGVLTANGGIGGTQSLPYYVMPLVEGQSLRERLKREIQLPLETVLEIAKGVASALDYAHRRGLIHRDIKPENILLHDGQALVADFGIALALSTAGGTRLTETGISIGTPQYMSPEQSVGERDVSGRTDVYALGCVVYEMFAGEPPFTGPTAQAIAVKAVHDTPRPLRAARPSLPAAVESAVRRALEKLPADRFETAGEFANALTAPAPPGERATAPSTDRKTAVSSDRRWFALLMALGLAVGAAIWGWLRSTGAASEYRTAQFEIELPPDLPSHQLIGPRAALAPDGRTIAYLGIEGGTRKLFLRSLADVEARPLLGTDGASVPFFSPDNKWIGFVADGELRKVPTIGAQPISIGKTPGIVTGASWGSSDVIVFTTYVNRGLWRVPASGGNAQLVVRPDSAAGEQWQLAPDVLPGGSSVLFAGRFLSATRSQISVVPLAGGKVVRLLAGSDPHYSPTGHIVFRQLEDGSLAAVRFDLRNLRVSGVTNPVHVVPSSNDLGTSQFAISRSGDLIYVRLPPRNESLVLVDRAGMAVPLTAEVAHYVNPRFSPDGNRLSVGILNDDRFDVWIYGLARHAFSRLTFQGSDGGATWTPDGRSVTYGLEKRDSNTVFVTPADGTGSPAPLYVGQRVLYVGAWTPDGRTLVAWDGVSPSSDLWLIFADASHPPRRLLQTESHESNPVPSPDGRWIAYTSNVSGQTEVYVRSFPAFEGQWQVSKSGGTMPVWARNGRELFYRHGDRLYSVPVTLGTTFSIGTQKLLFESAELNSERSSGDYDIEPDGQHFIMVKRARTNQRLMVVLGWFREWSEQKPN